MHFTNIEFILKLMTFLGVNPYNNSRLHTILFYSLMFAFSIYIFLTISILYFDGEAEFEERLNVINVSGYFVHGLICLGNFHLKKSTILDLLNLVKNKFWYYGNLDICEDEKKTHARRNKILYLKYKLYFSIVTLDAVLVTISPLIIDCGNISRENFPLPIYFPEGISVYVIYLGLVYVSFNNLYSAIATDGFVLTLANLAEFQFNMLNQELINLFTNLEKYGNPTNIRKRLNVCNQHLSDLHDFRNLLNDCFSIVSLLFLGILTLSLCLNMYVLSSTNSLYLMFFTTIYGVALFIQFTYCYFYPIQCMINAAEATANSFYLSDWYNYPEYHKETCLLLGKTQQNMYLSAGGLVDINYLSLLSTMKSVFSYVAFLRTVAASEK